MNPRVIALGAAAALAILFLGLGAFRVARLARAHHEAEMGLLDHLRELRYRVLASLAAVTIGTVALFSFDVRQVTLAGAPLWVPIPSVVESLASRLLDVLLAWALPEFVALVVLTPSEAILAQLQAAIIGGLVLASPYVAYHVAAFVAPALHPNERRTVGVLSPLALVLFLGGVAFGALVMVRVTLATLYAYAEPLGAEAFARPQEVVSFILLTCALFGVAFETPLVMAGLSYAGLVHPSAYTRHWRGVMVAILVLAAIVTDPSPVSQMLVAIPLVLLYFGGALVARALYRRGKRRS